MEEDITDDRGSYIVRDRPLFKTADDRQVFIAITSNGHWQRFCQEFGRCPACRKASVLRRSSAKLGHEGLTISRVFLAMVVLSSVVAAIGLAQIEILHRFKDVAGG